MLVGVEYKMFKVSTLRNLTLYLRCKNVFLTKSASSNILSDFTDKQTASAFSALCATIKLTKLTLVPSLSHCVNHTGSPTTAQHKSHSLFRLRKQVVHYRVFQAVFVLS